jgi:integrase
MRTGRGEGLVFGADGATPFAYSSVVARARRAWREAGAGLDRPAHCRHTFASILIAAGVNAKALSTYLGHSSIQITIERYGHLMPGNYAVLASCRSASQRSM